MVKHISPARISISLIAAVCALALLPALSFASTAGDTAATGSTTNLAEAASTAPASDSTSASTSAATKATSSNASAATEANPTGDAVAAKTESASSAQSSAKTSSSSTAKTSSTTVKSTTKAKASATKPAAEEGWTTDSAGNTNYYRNGAKVTGWLIDSTYKSYGLQRYWLDASGNLAKSRLISSDEAGYWAYATEHGHVVRGRYVTDNGTVYLADQTGKLENPGWIVTDAYTPGTARRYRIDATTHAATIGFYTLGANQYYGVATYGYTVTGKKKLGTGLLVADSKGRLVTQKGWMVTKKYDGAYQRYYFDYVCNDHIGAKINVFKRGKFYYFTKPSQGYVVRGIQTYKGSTFVGDSKGRLSYAVARSSNTWKWKTPHGYNRNQAASVLMKTAKKCLGTKYTWGGTSPSTGMDCSGFVFYCYRQLGITLAKNWSRSTYAMVQLGKEISLDNAQPGDLIFMYYNGQGPGHVVMYAGHGMIYEEPDFGGSCQYVSLASKYANDIHVRRVLR